MSNNLKVGDIVIVKDNKLKGVFVVVKLFDWYSFPQAKIRRILKDDGTKSNKVYFTRHVDWLIKVEKNNISDLFMTEQERIITTYKKNVAFLCAKYNALEKLIEPTTTN